MDIISVVKSYGIALEKAGSIYVGLCPFHNDMHTPNLVVYPRNDSFYCFTCHEGGTLWWFISRIEHIPLSEVKKRYADTILKHKINKIDAKHEHDFKNELLTNISSVTRNFLSKYPQLLDQVLDILKDIDSSMLKQETMNRNVANELRDILLFRIEKLKEKMHVS